MPEQELSGSGVSDEQISNFLRHLDAWSDDTPIGGLEPKTVGDMKRAIRERTPEGMRYVELIGRHNQERVQRHRGERRDRKTGIIRSFIARIRTKGRANE